MVTGFGLDLKVHWPWPRKTTGLGLALTLKDTGFDLKGQWPWLGLVLEDHSPWLGFDLEGHWP